MQTFSECGWAAYAAVGSAALAVFVSLVAVSLAFAKPRVGGAFSVVALALALTPAGCGVIGNVQGKSATDSVVDSAAIDPEMRERIRAKGYEEAGACITVGLGASAAPLLLSVLALVVAFVRRQPVEG